VTINLNLLTGAYPVTGDVVRFEGPGVPGGIVEAANYFLKKTPSGAYQLSTRKNLSDTVDITSSGGGGIRKQGWIMDPDDPGRTLYAKAHHYSTGDPVRLKSSGKLPAPLAPDRAYFVIARSADTFQLAASRAEALSGAAIALTTLGAGVFETAVEWAWRLASGQPASARPEQPVQVNDLGAFYQVTNGLTGVRVVKAAGNPSPFQRAPIQGIRLGEAAWTATGPNYLYESYSQKLAAFVKSYSVAVIESGPLLVRLEATYALDRPEYTYGSGHTITAVDPVAHTVALAGDLYYWNGPLRCNSAATVERFRAGWRRTSCIGR